MRVLVIYSNYPLPDQSAGDLRFYTLLTLLANQHTILFCAPKDDGTPLPPNEAAERLKKAGIFLCDVDFFHALQDFKPDVIWFEFYHQARPEFLALIQRFRPQARVVVDSVDVHFNRLEAKAKLTGKLEDVATARREKGLELAVYARSDMIIAVSEDERQLILQALPNKPVEIVPLIYSFPDFPDKTKRLYDELVFVGGFKHDPNVDAMLYFCGEIMPLIRAAHPQTRLKIIGSNPPQSILSLASEHVNVLGYVPETAPYLESAYISVAPLRYGGGVKGKVAEAMSYGLPVVTTSSGAEGFGLQPDVDFLIGDTAESFAAQVLALLNDTDLHGRISQNGYNFIKQHYSVPVVQRLLETAMQALADLPPRKIKFLQRLTLRAQSLYDQHIAWRIKKLWLL
jgi:glycosyltransferase involved in cell wall biosynthesis